jgi:CRISPR-associated protein Cmr6
MDQNDREWNLGEDKKKFLDKICAFDGGKDDFAGLVGRRKAVLASPEVKAVCHPVTSTSRLVCGMGLPHPVETSILLDRLTGAPYLPGSSVKGMLRGAAKLAAAGEFPTDFVSPQDASFWKGNLDLIFGPAVEKTSGPAKGEMVFYDALPEKWPVLELDVLTPHYAEYYSDKEGRNPPADWYNPTPVYFLAVKAGTSFLFWYRSLAGDPQKRTQDEDAIARLLPVALDWLGIGGKKSSGYGWFSADQEDVSKATGSVTASVLPRHSPERFPAQGSGGTHSKSLNVAPPPPHIPSKTETWKGCEVGYLGMPCVTRGKKQVAFDDSTLLPAAMKANKLKTWKGVKVDVDVVYNGVHWRITKVLVPKPLT